MKYGPFPIGVMPDELGLRELDEAKRDRNRHGRPVRTDRRFWRA